MDGGTVIDLTHIDDLGGVEWCDHFGIDYRRMRAELEFVEAHRDDWIDHEWAPDNPRGQPIPMAAGAVLRTRIGLAGSGSGCRPGDGSGATIREEARRVFGLSAAAAKRWFKADNSLHLLWRIASELTHGAIQRPAPARPTTRHDF